MGGTLGIQVDLKAREDVRVRIGQVARVLGVPAHVLRHWDEVGVVVPERTAIGHRDYSEEHLNRLRVLMACQQVGMSLSEIRQVLHRGEAGRTAAIERRLADIRAQRDLLESAEEFLTHVIDCQHDLLTTCDRCSRYAERPVPTPRQQAARMTPRSGDATPSTLSTSTFDGVNSG